MTRPTRRRALIVAFHFPPASGSSGVQRAFSLAKYLPEFGWDPIVLTAAPRAHEIRSASLLEQLPGDLHVTRAFALDVPRHLSLRGAYPDFMAYPDRWNTWIPFAISAGRRMIRRFRPEVIYSTYPISSAHVIANALRKRSGLPWVADFRDSMTEAGYPADETKRRIYRRIETQAARHAASLVFTSPGTLEGYRSRFPDCAHGLWRLVENGFDEEVFETAEARVATNERATEPGRCVLLHSGVIYPNERDPRHFFEAIGTLKARGRVSPTSLEVRLRATGHDAHIQSLIDEHGVSDIVRICPRLPYEEAIREMIGVDGLLIMQASNCNHQTPAKVYEYLRAGPPVLALTDSNGDTARLLRQWPHAMVTELNDARAIEGALPDFMRMCDDDSQRGRKQDVGRYSRRAGVRRFAELFDAVSDQSAADRRARER